jgi:hypothetical protein
MGRTGAFRGLGVASSGDGDAAMIFPGLPPRCQHLTDPVTIPRAAGWLSIDAAAAAVGLRAENVCGTWDRLVAETWAIGRTMAGGSPVRMALCSDGFLDEWRMDARDLPAFRQEFSALERARALAFQAKRDPAPDGPMSNEWLSFGQVARRMGSSQKNASMQAFWISVTTPQEFDRRGEPYMQGVRLSLRRDGRTGLDLWALRADDFDRFGNAYLAAHASHAPRKANVRQPGEISCEEGWALFGRTLHWETYFLSWHHRRGSRTVSPEPTYKSLAVAYAVARNVANIHSGYGTRHTPISILMNHVEPDLRRTVRDMLREFDEAGTEGAIGPLRDRRRVVCTTYVDGVPLPSVTGRFMAEARRRLSPPREDAEPAPAFGM